MKNLLAGIESENDFYSIVFQFLFKTSARLNEVRTVKYYDEKYSIITNIQAKE